MPRSIVSTRYESSSFDEIFITSMERTSASFLSFNKLNMSTQSTIWSKIINVTPADSTDVNYFNRCRLSDDNSKLYTQVVHSTKALLMVFNSIDGAIIGLRYKILINSGQYGFISIVSSKVQSIFDFYTFAFSTLIIF